MLYDWQPQKIVKLISFEAGQEKTRPTKVGRASKPYRK
jgi:hypothetical protein